MNPIPAQLMPSIPQNQGSAGESVSVKKGTPLNANDSFATLLESAVELAKGSYEEPVSNLPKSDPKRTTDFSKNDKVSSKKAAASGESSSSSVQTGTSGVLSTSALSGLTVSTTANELATSMLVKGTTQQRGSRSNQPSVAARGVSRRGGKNGRLTMKWTKSLKVGQRSGVQTGLLLPLSSPLTTLPLPASSTGRTPEAKPASSTASVVVPQTATRVSRDSSQTLNTSGLAATQSANGEGVLSKNLNRSRIPTSPPGPGSASPLRQNPREILAQHLLNRGIPVTTPHQVPNTGSHGTTPTAGSVPVAPIVSQPEVLVGPFHTQIGPQVAINASDPQAYEKFSQLIVKQVRTAPNTLQVQVQPQGMGTLLISVTKQSQGIQVHVEANQLQTVQWLNQMGPQISDAVKNNGVQLTGIQIAYGNTSMSNSAGDTSTGQQSSSRRGRTNTIRQVTASNRGSQVPAGADTVSPIGGSTRGINIRV
ncbi:flagellar hook-length control protein FliK [Alicyclobacillus tolerans]|uniref:flagellar hook-length control protein FliK n=1 Tax=Alicyclobacillus tolerans TaxID=90970 RepID=UPI001F24CFA0|nr:flagellar hook-length control protein FliK [Alicyclobacillus tolerans]MCF8567483.1 flagellar hook-length control protein FliK [Alicyclobacillus tolerans]